MSTVASLTDPQLRAAAERAEKVFPHLAHCARCGKFLRAELTWRRLYVLPGVRAALVLCDACNSAVPIDSPADAEFRAWIQAQAIAHAPVQGRA